MAPSGGFALSPPRVEGRRGSAPQWCGPQGHSSPLYSGGHDHRMHILSGSLATRYSDFPGFRPIFGQTWPQKPSRTTGLVLQCHLNQKSAPQTNSKAIHGPKPYKFIGFGDIHSPKPYKFVWFGDIRLGRSGRLSRRSPPARPRPVCPPTIWPQVPSLLNY